jgi:hypothetical protein
MHTRVPRPPEQYLPTTNADTPTMQSSLRRITTPARDTRSGACVKPDANYERASKHPSSGGATRLIDRLRDEAQHIRDATQRHGERGRERRRRLRSATQSHHIKSNQIKQILLIQTNAASAPRHTNHRRTVLDRAEIDRMGNH